MLSLPAGVLPDPDVEFYTNAIEHSDRPVAVGRNNWRVVGSPRGARFAADHFSLIDMCETLRIDPHNNSSITWNEVPRTPISRP